MGFVGLLQFAVRYCVGVLAWPVIALGYPLCAFIKAIETNSVSDTQKLNTYWVTFSLILLFEHAFAMLFGWLVIWPYIRLMIVCCLVIPYFDGAFYVYNHIIRPCLSVDPQIVIDWFNKRKESSYLKDYILTEMERYVKEKGPEALEKILASKSSSTKPNLDVQEIESVPTIENKVVEKSGDTKPNLDVQEIESALSIDNKVVEKMKFQALLAGAFKDLNPGSPNVTQKDIKSVEVLEKKEVRAAAEQVSRVEPNLTQVENIYFVAPEIKKMVPEVVVAAHRELPKIPSPPDHKVQKWTCKICQVTTASEIALENHYYGKNHKAKTLPKDVPTSIRKNSNRPAVELRNRATSKGLLGKFEVQGQPQSIHASAARKAEPKEEPAKRVTTSSSGIKQKVNVEPEEKVYIYEPNKPNQGSKFGVQSSSLWCSICNVSCTSEIDMLSHIRGRRHSELVTSNWNVG